MHHLESNLHLTPKEYIQTRFFLGRDKELAAMKTMKLTEEEESARLQRGNVNEILGRAVKGGELCYEVRKTATGLGVTKWEPAKFLHPTVTVRKCVSISTRRTKRCNLFRRATADVDGGV